MIVSPSILIGVFSLVYSQVSMRRAGETGRGDGPGRTAGETGRGDGPGRRAGETGRGDDRARPLPPHLR